MIIARTGPSLSQLRRCVGTRTRVEFQSRTPIAMTVNTISCATGYELPIDIPDYTGMQPAWYVTGDSSENDETIVALVLFGASGRMTFAVLAVITDENEGAEATPVFWMKDTFAKYLAASLVEQPS